MYHFLERETASSRQSCRCLPTRLVHGYFNTLQIQFRAFIIFFASNKHACRKALPIVSSKVPKNESHRAYLWVKTESYAR